MTSKKCLQINFFNFVTTVPHWWDSEIIIVPTCCLGKPFALENQSGLDRPQPHKNINSCRKINDFVAKNNQKDKNAVLGTVHKPQVGNSFHFRNQSRQIFWSLRRGVSSSVPRSVDGWCFCASPIMTHQHIQQIKLGVPGTPSGPFVLMAPTEHVR